MHYMKEPAMEEARVKILAILKEHDLMGCVLIASKERSGFFQEVSPSWSCARTEITPDGEVGVRVLCKREDYPSAEAQQEQLEHTVNGLLGLLHVHEYIGQALTALVKMISQKVTITSVAKDGRIQSATEI